MNKLTSLALTSLWLAQPATLHAANAANLRCESLTNPLGIDQRQPRLGWFA
jgi:alpha-L-rhamnosidase